MNDATFIVAYCSSCNVNIFRSIKALIIGKDTLSPDLFRPTSSEYGFPEEGKATCPICATPLRFIAEQATLPPPARPEPAAPVRGVSEAPRPSGVVVQELFRVEPDEVMVEASDTGDSFLVVTNKRILKVTK